MQKRIKTKNVIVYLLGIAVSVVPVSAAALSYFPLWKQSGDGKLISGFAFILLLLAAKPIFNHFKRELSSPSVPLMWLLLFTLFFSLSRIADEITVIAFVGFVSNSLGAVLFRISDMRKKQAVNTDEPKL